MSLRWLVLDEVESTQDVAKLRVHGDIDVVFAHHQTNGRGRFDRVWESQRGASLTMSIIVRNSTAPAYLHGMSLALTAAEVLNVQVQWPNDLVSNGKKVGGVLSEVVEEAVIVGLGINLAEGSVPPELEALAGHIDTIEDSLAIAHRILESFTTPASWSEISDRWQGRDATPGKRYVPADGKPVTAIRVNDMGALIGERDGKVIEILAADAMPGS